MISKFRKLFTAKRTPRRLCARLLIGCLALLSLTGCSSFRQQLHECNLHDMLRACRSYSVARNVDNPRDAVFWASQHEQAGSEKSVDLYFLAVTFSHQSPFESQSVYHESVAGLIRTAQQFGRYDPVQGIRVQGPDGPLTIPISYRGFTWGPSDFSRLVVANRFVGTELKTQYYCEGIGVPLIAIRETETAERFHASRTHFAATAILKIDPENGNDCAPRWTLDLTNPLAVSCTEFNGQRLRVAADYTAPTRYTVGRERRTYLRDFLRPGVTMGEAKLMLLEPYQRGKIPVIFIHGLLSDPMTWADLFEALHVDPEFQDRYQFWAFQYPTGKPFLRSAAVLREELAAAVASMDPDGTDPALSQMVLIGHSMGGLVAELQITSSEDRFWRSFANRPMETLELTSQMRSMLQDLFYFEPSPHIGRVVFIGTPHNGSVEANRLIGKIGSNLVRLPSEERRQYEAFLAYNPGVVHPFAAKRIPTSVDMLEPDNPILKCMASLTTSPCVTTHSIIGTGGCCLSREPSDGVVPITSAQIPGVESELYVDEDHEHLHRDPETIQEVTRILRRHLRCVDGNR